MKIITKFINLLLSPIVFFRDFRVEKDLKNLSEKERFTLFYKNSYWKPFVGGSLSGSGSTKEATDTIKLELKNFIDKYNIKSMLDVPCGDWHWMSEVDLQSVEYLGGDIVNDLVESNNERFSSNNINFIEINIINDNLPKVDLVFVRDCFVHLEYDDIVKALKNIAASGSKYLVSTTFPGHKKNGAILNKDRWRKLNLTKAPFLLTKELELLPDMGNSSTDSDKYMGVWLIDDMFN